MTTDRKTFLAKILILINIYDHILPAPSNNDQNLERILAEITERT